jgi:DNA-directed RNA polymerase subunit RPC12/RpoP
MMKICPNCKKSVYMEETPNYLFINCPYCGAPLNNIP